MCTFLVECAHEIKVSKMINRQPRDAHTHILRGSVVSEVKLDFMRSSYGRLKIFDKMINLIYVSKFVSDLLYESPGGNQVDGSPPAEMRVRC